MSIDPNQEKFNFWVGILVLAFVWFVGWKMGQAYDTIW